MNVYEDVFDVERERWGGGERLRNVGHALGTALLGATLFEVEPGYAGPYHLHHGNEELVLVIDGTPTLRSPTASRGFAAATSSSSRAGPRGCTRSRTARASGLAL